MNPRRAAPPRVACALGLTLALALAPAGGGRTPGAVTPAFAQDSLEATKRREIEAIRRQAAEKRAAATRLKGQENSALLQLHRTERQLNVTHRRLAGLQQRRGQLDRQLDVTRADLDRNLSTLRDKKERLARRLRSLYKYGGPGRELEFLLSPQSFAQLLSRWDFLVMVAEQDRVLLEDVQARKELVEATKQRIETTLTETDRTAKRTNTENRRLAQLRHERAGSVQQIQSQREAYEAAAAELENTARSLQRLLAQLERRRKEETTKARAEGRTPQPYTGDFAKGQGRLDWPLRGTIVGRFGPEKHPKWGTVTLNNGIDIETDIGTPVVTVAKGRVDYVSEDFASYGQMIVINHGDGYYTLYGNLSSIAVAVGQEVQAGQVVARSGESGSLKGPILHFEVRKGGTSLNPEEWLQ